MTDAPSLGLRRGFWAVALAFLVVMAFSTLPSPLYGLYQQRDGFASFTITVIFGPTRWAGS